MKRLSVIIATDSQVEALGVRALLTTIKEVHLETVIVSTAEICNSLQKIMPAAIIADISDPIAVEEILRAKNELKLQVATIGLYHSALPMSTVRAVDATFSIYDNAETLNDLLKRIVNVSADATTNDLTPREREVIRGIVKGLSNKEIAAEINVSVNTVMTHRRNIASKLRIHSPAGLTIFAIVSKIVSLDEIKDQVGAIND